LNQIVNLVVADPLGLLDHEQEQLNFVVAGKVVGPGVKAEKGGFPLHGEQRRPIALAARCRAICPGWKK
jgi:hypothetical protein